MDECLNIRSAVAGDISRIAALERQCPTAAHWSDQQYEQLFEPRADVAQTMAWVAEQAHREGKQIVGFLVARQIAPEWELENIVVAPSERRKGLGKRLLAALLTQARDTGSESVFLEVRESNTAARTLYETAGFRQTARRRSYYSNPPEDALLYRLDLR